MTHRIFHDANNIVEAQIIQDEMKNIRMMIVSSSEFYKNDANLLAKNLRSRIGKDMKFVIKIVSKIKEKKTANSEV